MVTVETRVQQAIKEILIEEIWNYLKTKNNFDKVLSIASLIDSYDEEPDVCYEDCRGMCFGCYDGYKNPIGWQAYSNLLNNVPFRYLTSHELTHLTCAWNKEIHACTEGCSRFVCFEYLGETCGITYCSNLFIKTKSNMKYCSSCRATPGTIYHQNYNCSEDCYCKKFISSIKQRSR